MTPDRFDKLLTFVQKLEAARIPFQMKKTLEDAIGVLAFAPGEYWEVDFLENGEVYVERFRSDGRILDETALTELFALWAEDETPAPEPVGENATTT